MNDVLFSAFFFVIAIGVLVTVHEFGHFVFARLLGVKVLRFSVGFGKALWRWRRRDDETEYVIAALPLGGYVQMLDEREGPVAEHELHRAFNRKPLGSRAAIVFAGPVFNFLLAIAAYWLVFVIGVPGIKPLVGEVTPGSPAAQAGLQRGDLILSIDGREVATWNAAFLELLDKSLSRAAVTLEVRPEGDGTARRTLDFSRLPAAVDRSNLLDIIGIDMYRPSVPPVVGALEAGGAAERAGLKAGDRIVAINAQPIASWEDLVSQVRDHPGALLAVEIARGDRRLELQLRPDRLQTEEGDVGHIGARVELPEDLSEELRATERHSVLGAVGAAVGRTWEMSALTLRMLGSMVIGEVSVTNLGGPIRIAQYAGYSASAGVVQFIGFLALISISLGVLNLLPIPVLDGGHLLYYLIELVKGSPLSEQAQLLGQRLGVAILIGVMVLAFYNDLVQLFG